MIVRDEGKLSPCAVVARPWPSQKEKWRDRLRWLAIVSITVLAVTAMLHMLVEGLRAL